MEKLAKLHDGAHFSELEKLLADFFAFANTIYVVYYAHWREPAVHAIPTRTVRDKATNMTFSFLIVISCNVRLCPITHATGLFIYFSAPLPCV